MTRSYFINYVSEWDELIELCRDYDCNICEAIIDDDELDDYIESDIANTDYGWRAIRDFLAEIPTGYNYYLCNGSFDYIGLNDSDFEDYKNSVLEWMDRNGLWDEEDEDENEGGDGWENDHDFFSPGEEDEKEPVEPPVEEEDFSVSELMNMCGAELVTIRQIVERKDEHKDAALLYAF